MMATRPQGEPTQLVAASVVHLARELHRATNVQELLDTPVLIPNTKNHAVLLDLDRAIIDYLPSLTAVCSQPHDRLTVEQVLVRAPLARRVPVAGLIRLASHSEDWATVEFNRVIPQRLLARRYVDDYDFYENQMAAQLVDRLHRYLSGRLRNLSMLERHIVDLSKYEYALQGPQSHWKRQRLATLLTEATKTQRQAEPIEDTLRQLKELHAQVNLLRGSPLYQHANRRTTIPFRLPRTNLLTRDRRYHRTALLWEAWALREASDTIARQEYHQRFPAAYVAYVTAIVLRAYEILGLMPADSAAQLQEPLGSTIELVSDHVRLFMQVQDCGVIELRSGDRAVVRVVPLDMDLTAEQSPIKVREVMASVFQNCEAVVTPTVIVYPGQRELRATLPADVQRLLHATGPLPPDSGAPAALFGIIPVTPLEIESTERMARALRWAWYGMWIRSAYPPQVVTPPWLALKPAEWLSMNTRDWRLLRPPTSAESAALYAEISKNYAEHARRTRNARLVDTMGQTMDAIRRAEDDIRRLATCPLRSCTNRVSFEPWKPNTFHCRCADCEAQWGTRICGSCRQQFPVLWVKNAVGASQNGDQIDATFGSEVLALPCPAFPDWKRFRCPWCNVCQGAPACHCG